MERELTQTGITRHFIAGRPETGGSRRLERFDPATGEQMGYVTLGDESTVNTAVDSSSNAYQDWRLVEPAKRAVIIRKFCDAVSAHADELCRLITLEHGKTLLDAQGELQRGIENIEYATGIAEHLKGEYSKAVGPDIDSWSEMSPLGVVVGITPFNFPVMVPMWMFPLAIACGNTFILKPSERDPSPSIYIAKLLSEAGIPNGVFNVLNGDKETVDMLLSDERIQAVSFVGSTPIAESIYQKGTDAGKRVQALGGAKNHAVVMPDADVDNAVSALMGAAYGSCGERCMAISVAVCVGEEAADKVVTRLESRIKKLKIGPGEDASNDMGPLITKDALARIYSYIEQGLEQGAELIVDGRNLVIPDHENGFFIGGCLFDEVTENMSIYTDEIFGPVLCVVRVKDLDEAMTLINKHEYGNGA
ncbi:MAG: CoA-acylating methylmalonate-semialdehyde dehydrogenase, partial [Pseudomonadales bacterium]|nr:CoA-acylating methylmalonate-semialdehyde dehydrogenase [Pseudomonadales bacterium]